MFTLLALVNDRAVMASTLTGLTSGNPALRGTAMEYLESTLPPSLRRPLWKRIDAPSPKSERRRTRDSMADELLRTQVDWVVDRAELDAHREAVSLQEED